MVDPSRMVAAAAALPALESEETSLLRSASAFFIRYRVHHEVGADDPVTDDATYRDSAKREHPAMIARPEVRARAAALGFRYLGGYEYFSTFGFTQRDLWLSEDGSTRLSGRRASAGGVEGMMSPYILSTVFDDRTSIVTWGGASPIASSERVESRGGSGDLDRDAASHREAVRAHLEGEARASVRVLTPSNVKEANALSRYFDVFLVPDAVHLANLRVRIVVYAVVAFFLSALVNTIARLARGH